MALNALMKTVYNGHGLTKALKIPDNKLKAQKTASASIQIFNTCR